MPDEHEPVGPWIKILVPATIHVNIAVDAYDAAVSRFRKVGAPATERAAVTESFCSTMEAALTTFTTNLNRRSERLEALTASRKAYQADEKRKAQRKDRKEVKP